MDFIFMLTRGDETVADGLQLLDALEGLGLRHVGFKDIGADRPTLRQLSDRIRAMDAASYLEIVSASAEDCVAAARLAAEIGVDHLLGGTAVDEVLRALDGTGIGYYPFPGYPSGHPTRLGGTAADIAGHCTDFMARGCAGADLLAYRATGAEPLELVRAARSALGSGRLIVAGSVCSTAQLADLAHAGADAFTIGTAIFDDSFAAGESGIANQIRAIQRCLAGDPEAAASAP